MKKRILSIVLVWCCMSGLAHGQNTANDLLAICETFERTAQISGTDVAVPNIDAGRCFAYFTAVHQIVYLHLNGSDLCDVSIHLPAQRDDRYSVHTHISCLRAQTRKTSIKPRCFQC